MKIEILYSFYSLFFGLFYMTFFFIIAFSFTMDLLNICLKHVLSFTKTQVFVKLYRLFLVWVLKGNLFHSYFNSLHVCLIDF